MLPMALSFFETLFNRAIQFDARTAARLKVLNGQGLYLEITDLKLGFTIFFTENGIQLQKESELLSNNNEWHPRKAISVRIFAPLVALMSFAGSRDIKQAMERGLIMEGDMETASEIQHFMTDLNIDWEEMLSRCTGDVVAHQFFNFFKKAKRKKRETLDSLYSSSSDFLQEELKLLPTASEVENFNQSVDNLRDELERMEARIQVLGAQISKE
jgi:ubiquinone biosynthesis protein UbiJ